MKDMEKMKAKALNALKWSEKYTKTDMVYLVKNSFWLNLNMIIVAVLSFILSIVFARFLSKEEYGTYQFILSIASMIGALTLTGMNTAVIQAVARGFEGILKRSVVVQLMWGVIPFIASLGISIYYLLQGNNSLSIAFVVIAIFLPLSNALNTYGSFFVGKKNFKAALLYAQIVNILYYGAMFTTMFFFKSTALLLITINFGINTLAALTCYILTLRIYKPNEKNEDEAISYGKKLSLSSILPAIASNIDNVVIFHFLGAVDLAIYSFASNIPERLGGLLRPISTIAFPKFSEKDPEELRKIIPKKTLQLFLISLFGGLIYLLISPLIFKIFFPQYLESIIYSQAYTLAVIASITGSLTLTSIFATRSKAIFKFNIINPIFNIVIITLFVFFFGIWGAIFGKIIGNSFSLLYSYILKNE